MTTMAIRPITKKIGTPRIVLCSLNNPNAAPGFLTETDVNVQHSLEHFRAALDRLRGVPEPKDIIATFLWRAVRAGAISEQIALALESFAREYSAS